MIRKQLLARLHRLARSAERNVVVLARELADTDGVGAAIERSGVDERRRVEPGVLRVLRRHVRELEQAERVRGGVRPARVELLAGLRSRELPGRVLAAALDAPAAARGVADFERLHLLHLERGAVDPVGGPGARLRQRIGDDIDQLGLAGQADEAAIGRRAVGIVDLAPEVFLADDQAPERFAARAAELDLGPGPVQVEPGAIPLGRRLALADLQLDHLEDEFAHLADIGGESAALGDHPGVLLALQGERGLRLDDADLRDGGCLQLLEQRLPERSDVFRPARALLALEEQRRAAQHHQQHHQDRRRPGVHAVLVFLMKAINKPASATSSGISTMFASLVQNTRLSASWRRFLRTSFSASRASATVLRKRSSSACCSGVRIWHDLPAPLPCAFCSSCSLAVVFCSSSSRLWILPKYCFCASASSSRTTVSGRNAVARLLSEISSLPAANCSTMPSASARLPFEGTTMRRPNTSWISTAAPSASMSTSATRMTVFSALDSRSCGVPGRGLLSTRRPSGKAVLNLPLKRSASASACPEGLKFRVASSPDLVALAASTSIELGELLTSSVIRSPSAGFAWKAPPKAYSRVSIDPVTTSSRLNAVRLSES